jgi:hypothetical protein
VIPSRQTTGISRFVAQFLLVIKRFKSETDNKQNTILLENQNHKQTFLSFIWQVFCVSHQQKIRNKEKLPAALESMPFPFLYLPN